LAVFLSKTGAARQFLTVFFSIPLFLHEGEFVKPARGAGFVGVAISA